MPCLPTGTHSLLWASFWPDLLSSPSPIPDYYILLSSEGLPLTPYVFTSYHIYKFMSPSVLPFNRLWFASGMLHKNLMCSEAELWGSDWTMRALTSSVDSSTDGWMDQWKAGGVRGSRSRRGRGRKALSFLRPFLSLTNPPHPTRPLWTEKLSFSTLFCHNVLAHLRPGAMELDEYDRILWNHKPK